MSEYQLELKQIVDYPRCRIYRQFIGLLMKDKSIRVGGTSGLYHFTVLSCFANFRTSYKRIDGISYTIYPGEWLCRVSELTEWFRTRFQHQALAILRELQDRHLITYTLLGRGRLVKFKIKGWCKYNRVLEYNAPCQKDTGFFFLPISVANELVSAGRCSEMDAMLDLWINTVYNDTQVQGSEVGPVVYMRNGTGSPLIGYAELAQRWGVSKATAGRYLRKMQELDYLSMVAFPGTHGTAIYLKQYLSTMFQISDVMIDKDEVAMSLMPSLWRFCAHIPIRPMKRSCPGIWQSLRRLLSRHKKNWSAAANRPVGLIYYEEEAQCNRTRSCKNKRCYFSEDKGGSDTV